jgi:hypothetical protein
MIENQKQYGITKTWADRFKKDADSYKALYEAKFNDVLVKAVYDGLISQYDDLMQQLYEYDNSIDGIKIFKINDYEWYAGKSFEECVQFAISESGCERDEYEESGIPAKLEHKAVSEEGIFSTFREELQKLINENQQFPCFFCGEE